MKRFCILVALLVVLGGASLTWAATVYVDVTTDKGSYVVGETVNWTIWVWSSPPLAEPPVPSIFPDNHGIALLKVDLDESRGETLSPALITEISPDMFDLTGSACRYATGFNLCDYDYDSDGNGTLLNVHNGVPTPEPGGLVDIIVYQNEEAEDPELPPITFDIGNDGEDNPCIFAQGSFIVTKTGEHTLSAAIQTDGANYWPDHDAVAHNPVPFEQVQEDHADFTVDAVAPPVADAGADAFVYEENTCNLDGSNSTGADTYAWEQTGGKSVTLLNADTATPSFVAPTVSTVAEAQLTFKLTVTNAGGNDDDEVDVKIRLRGDATGNDQVTVTDFSMWKMQNGMAGEGLTADFDASGAVTVTDFSIWKTNNGRALP